MTDWYKLSTEETISELATDREDGLAKAEVQQRLEKYGRNELVERNKTNPWQILLSQFAETMVIVLIVAAVISFFLGEIEDAVAIVVIVILNALLGFRQEYQAEKAMAALKQLAVPLVRVRRAGHVSEISARELVPGDVVLLEAGNFVPADGRLIESANLRVQEAALTGESEPVIKNANQKFDKDLSIGDRTNMVYMGTNVTYGRGQIVITTTGMDTELGGIAELMQSAGDEQTPLQKRLDQLGKGLAVVAAGLVALVVVLGLLRGQDLETLFLTGISLAVAAVPEGLPAVVTISLALGARRMLRRQALIRKLPAVETLGSVTVICSDKTGTLTENRMTVTVLDIANNRIDLNEAESTNMFSNRDELCADPEPTAEQLNLLKTSPALSMLLAGGALCNDAILDCEPETPAQFSIIGDPTEGALVVAAHRVGLVKEELENVFPRVDERPFDSDRKRMTTVHRLPEDPANTPEEFKAIANWKGWRQVDLVAFTKGAVDGLLQIVDRVWVEDHVVPLDQALTERIEKANNELAQNGMRVLAVAGRSLDAAPEPEEDIEKNLIFIGLVGMIDPARPEVQRAVETCEHAGIRAMMITGDHPLTARYIAQELGIAKGEDVVTGQQLEKMSPEELRSAVKKTSVFARVSPEHKLRIVEALQSEGHIAAMTGDGVNDAPALKKADIGVAMGITGTDVSKEAADMVLVDDNFATIVAAVEEGRAIYDNIRKFIKYTLSSNAGEIWVMLLSPFLGMPLALLPLQILWINLVTDGLPGLALGVEPAERNTMRRPPYPPDENIFARGVGRDILWVGLLMGFLSLGVGYFYWQAGNPAWQTMVFTTLVFAEMGFVMAIRSNRDSLFTIGPLTNRALIGAVALSLVLQLFVVYIPFLQQFFGTMALGIQDIILCLGLSVLLFTVVEIQKWFLRRMNPIV